MLERARELIVAVDGEMFECLNGSVLRAEF